MSLPALSPRAVNGTLAARGIKVPDLGQVAAYVEGLDGAGVEHLSQLLHRISLGVEDSQEVEQLLAEIRVAPATARSAERLPGRNEAKRTAPRSDLKLLRSHGAHVFGSSAALKVELVPCSEGPGRDEHATYSVLVEGAKKQGDHYAWDRKISFQLTRRELPVVTAFMLGLGGERLDLRNHGADHDKFLELEDQGHKIFAKLRQGNAAVAVPIEAGDVAACAEILLAALQLNRPTVPIEGQLAILRRVGRMHMAGKPG